ncbi:TPA: fimbrial protein [Aeromonas hydrophila]|nr:fimbrial protein [Aeromonas hydrophila]
MAVLAKMNNVIVKCFMAMCTCIANSAQNCALKQVKGQYLARNHQTGRAHIMYGRVYQMGKPIRVAGTLPWLMISLSLVSPWVNAANNLLPVTVKGTVRVAPTCVINNGDPISVSFGNEVRIDRIDEGIYLQSIFFNETCSGDVTTRRYKFDATKTAGNSIVATNYDKLGVEILANNVPINIGDWIDVSADDYMSFTARLVTLPTGAPLSAGTFNANATLIMEVN